MSETAVREDVEELVGRLRRTASAYREARQRVEDEGEQRLERLARHYREVTDLMDRYEERATSDGEVEFDGEAFLEYQNELARFVERVPEDLDYHEAFETVDEVMHKKWLKESDFREARAALSPVGDLVERLDERERARERYESAVHDVRARLGEVDERIDEHERLVELGDADLDAPTDRLRDPIEAYDEAVAEAFRSFRDSASAREVLSFVAATGAFPLVEFRQPPEDLRAYVERAPAGEEAIPKLLEYADYSVSKLDHYVEDARALKRHVATHQTYFRRLDAEPLTVGWPPPPAATLRWRCRELIPVVDKFADDEVLSALRTVRALPDREDYERLRASAVARAELGERERERLRSGAVQRELDRLREERERLQAALDDHAL